MTTSLTQCIFHAGAEAVQHIIGNKSLDRAGKAAAVNTASAPAAQKLFCQRQGKERGDLCNEQPPPHR